MRKGSKNTPVIISAGISLLFVTFIVLCLVVFAILSLSTAKSDSRLSAKRLEAVTEYYNACAKASETVAQIDRRLENLAKTELATGDGEISIEELRTAFSGQEEITFVAAGVKETEKADLNAGADRNTDINADANAGKNADISADTNVSKDEFPRLCFTQKINDYKNLEVTLRLTDASYGRLHEQTAKHYYEIESWKTVVEDIAAESTAQN